VLDWSPDSRWLLYLPWDGPRHVLRVMRANGSGKRRLPSAPQVKWLVDASFSPTGRRIAFSGTRDVANGEQQHAIWTMTVRGKQRRRIYEGVRSSDLDYGAPSDLSWQARPNR
jgi:Tol biopolymer transport system component